MLLVYINIYIWNNWIICFMLLGIFFYMPITKLTVVYWEVKNNIDDCKSIYQFMSRLSTPSASGMRTYWQNTTSWEHWIPFRSCPQHNFISSYESIFQFWNDETILIHIVSLRSFRNIKLQLLHFMCKVI